MRVLYGRVVVFGCALLPSNEFHDLHAPCNKHTLSVEAVGKADYAFEPNSYEEEDEALISFIQGQVTPETAAIVLMTPISWEMSEMELNLYLPRKNTKRFNPLKLPNITVVTAESENDFQIGYIPEEWLTLCDKGKLQIIPRSLFQFLCART